MTEKKESGGEKQQPKLPKNEGETQKNLNVNKNKKIWETIFNSIEDPNPETTPTNVSKNTKPIPDKESAGEKPIDRPHRNDMFTRNAMGEDEGPWVIHPLVEFRSPMVAKPSGDRHDPRILFMTPYTTIKQQGSVIDLYYCVIENHMSGDNEIYNFSILSRGEIKEFFGIDLHENPHNGLTHATERVFDNLDKIVELKKTIKDDKIIKSVIKEILKS